MRKTCAIYTLLFSLYVLSFSSCKKSESPYVELVAQNQWSDVLSVAQERFAASYGSLDLYYLARGSYETGDYDLALEATELYFLLTDEQDIIYPARALALQLPHYSERCEQGRILAEADMLTTGLAGAYYQALLSEGRTEEANAIFARHLVDTVDAPGYATLLLQDGSSLDLLLPALGALEDQERIRLIREAPIERYSPTVALAIAEFLEQTAHSMLSPELHYLRYESLWRLYSRAEMRVLANKYRSLSNQAAQGIEVDVSGD
ncbi:MAG TPA: hypothetical protein VFC80_01670 [Sphaerochaeta sp.]|nr:hypothetical protein [Sphaerochaeta sp.]